MNIKICEGNWCFENGRLFHKASNIEADFFEPDFLERWVYARFLRPDILALGFESGQPYSESGSYGNPLKGTIVLKHVDLAKWICVSFECAGRSYNESFNLVDVAWHESGVLASVEDDSLELIFLDTPREDNLETWLPASDSDYSSLITYLYGDFVRLNIAEDAHYLYALTNTSTKIIDLRNKKLYTGNGNWKKLEP